MITTTKNFTVDSTSNKYKMRIPLIENDTFYWKPRKWQTKAFGELKDSHNIFLCAPTGAGKTMVMQMLIHYKLTQNKNMKSIVLAPKRDIMFGYESCYFVDVDGKKQRMFSDIISDDHRNEMKKFLKSKSRVLRDRSIACTHQFLISFFKSLTEEEVKECFSGDFMFFVDEAHFLSSELVVDLDEDEKMEMNQLANIITYFMKEVKEVHLSTATPFRSDGKGLVEINSNTFDSYECNYITHLDENCKYLNHFTFNTVFYDSMRCKFTDAIKEIISNMPDEVFTADEAALIVIPTTGHTTTRFDFVDKFEQVEIIIGLWNAEAKKRGFGEQVAIDLVDDPNNKLDRIIKIENEKAKAIYSNGLVGGNRKLDKPNINLIIAMNKFNVGSDYIPLSHIVAPFTKSMVKIIQSAGRGFRDYVNKEKVSYITYAEGVIDLYSNEDKAKVREVLNHNLNHILTCLMMEQEFIDIPVRRDMSDNTPEEFVDDCDLEFETKKTWIDLFTREKLYKIKDKIGRKILERLPMHEMATLEHKWAIFENCVEEVLIENGVTDENILERLIKDYRNRWGVTILKFRGEPKYNADLIKSLDPAELFSHCLSKKLSSELIKQIRKIAYGSSHGYSMDEGIYMGFEYVKKHKRKLKFHNPEDEEEAIIVSLLKQLRDSGNRELFDKIALPLLEDY